MILLDLNYRNRLENYRPLKNIALIKALKCIGHLYLFGYLRISFADFDERMTFLLFTYLAKS
ncbi:hypothetical protein J2X97_001687 [Epilithonimonas hungarica]|nr:hypothetical protein [Epilithonimonas hungarica]